ncbi:MAG: tRNA dihydrouridine(20/20a) synthase DusA [Proteobacteria bacterium]|nr:tRNA dihydrouridine(20/20a) synthase DusA [Pseudomonadota bacterium]
MLDWTDKHCRYLHRLISRDVLLYSEMITTPAILQGDKQKYIGYNPSEHPLVLQLGGSNANDLAKSSVIAEEFGYDEINLNVGCPSDRVQKGRFGACLMNEPLLVVECISAMMNVVDIPITVKCRIGVDNNDSFENLRAFVEVLADTGMKTLIIHARKALLKGLSPKQNRSVPPLNYDFVYRIKQLFPELTVVINGGINSLEEVKMQLEQVDGVMLGRAIWNNPWLLHDLQSELFNDNEDNTRDNVLQKYIQYCKSEVEKGVKLHWLLPPVLNLYHGLIGNKKWKSHLVTQAPKRNKDLTVFEEARGYIGE